MNKRVLGSLTSLFVLGLWLGLALLGDSPVFGNTGPCDTSVPGDLAKRISFYAYAIATEATVKVFGFYVGPISPSNRRTNLFPTTGGRIVVQEAECASSYDNEPLCPPLLFLPEECVDRMPPSQGQRVISDKAVSIFKGGQEDMLIVYNRVLPYLDCELGWEVDGEVHKRKFVLTAVAKRDLEALRSAVRTMLPPEQYATVKALEYWDNRALKEYSESDEFDRAMWEQRQYIKIPPLDPKGLFNSVKNRVTLDLGACFATKKLRNMFPDKLFSTVVYFSHFGIDRQVDYRPVLKIPSWKAQNLTRISQYVEKGFGQGPSIEDMF